MIDILNWAEDTGAGTKKGKDDPIVLSGVYPVHWEKNSELDSTTTGTFWYLLNKIT